MINTFKKASFFGYPDIFLVIRVKSL